MDENKAITPGITRKKSFDEAKSYQIGQNF